MRANLFVHGQGRNDSCTVKKETFKWKLIVFDDDDGDDDNQINSPLAASGSSEWGKEMSGEDRAPLWGRRSLRTPTKNDDNLDNCDDDNKVDVGIMMKIICCDEKTGGDGGGGIGLGYDAISAILFTLCEILKQIHWNSSNSQF